MLYALANAPADKAMPMRELLIRGELDDTEIQTLLDFAIANGGIDYAFERMRHMQTEADKLIAPFPASTWKEAFRNIFEFIISRDK